ncbi:hypothetical protein B0J11DRAFT_532764 [Dendryphion nanum]|uniref:MACPF domain-containing protein n=1 Tax=Dendryphion nanum TaxID=256645 RepID=A0A9P9DKC3_9PLEO|nr:hypothetical protein B0J11DRAFT_532764 [Dendryphion nanum]
MSDLRGRRLEAKDYWPHFEDAGALNAWVIDSGGDVERARSQAFQLQQGKYPRIEYPEVIDEQHEQGLSSFLLAIGSSNHIDAADAAGSLNSDAWKLAKIGVKVDYVRNAQSKARNQRKNLSQSRSYTYQYPKMIAKVSTAALDLTPECKARLEELRKSPNDLNKWSLFHEEFGLFVCPIITFGGAIYTDRSLERVSEQDKDQQDGSNNASGEAILQSGSFLGNLDMKISTHSKEGQSQGSSSTSRTATKTSHWRKIGGRDPNSSFHEWIEELKDLTTWRIIRRSKPVLLIEMIPGIPGMEWVRDCFQPPQHPVRPLAEPAVPRLSRSPHPQSQLAFATLNNTDDDSTVLIFQNSLNHLVLVTLGILNYLAETPIVDNQVAPGTPLAIGRSSFISSTSKIYLFFADESHHLRDMYYDTKWDRWYEGHLHQSKIKIYQESALLFHCPYLYCQDPEGNILRVEMCEREWLNPLNLHTKESAPLHRAWIGTPITGDCNRYLDAGGSHTEVELQYLSSQGKIVGAIDGFIRPHRDPNTPAIENPRVSAWQQSPWVDTEQEVTQYPDFYMTPPDYPTWATPLVVFRTDGDFLNVCWQSNENEARWVFHPRICQTAPGSGFHLSTSSFSSCYTTVNIFFISQSVKLEMIEIDTHVSEDTPYISRRTIVDEGCGARPWKLLIMDTSSDESEV